MPASKLKISMNEYKRLIAEDSQKAAKDSVYGNLLSNLSDLTNLTQQYFSYDRNGKQPDLSAQDYERLIESYTKLAKSCSDFLSADHPKNRLENKRVNIIRQLRGYVGKDLQGLMNADKTKTATFSDVIKNARTRTIDLTGKDLGRIGGNMSSRIPMKTAGGTKGFFTKATVADFDKDFHSKLDERMHLLPEEFQDYLKDPEYLNDFIDFLTNETEEFDLFGADPVQVSRQYYRISATLSNSGMGEIEEITDWMKANPEDARNIMDTFNELRPIAAHLTVHQVAGITDNSRTDIRNAAMSDVAALMGMPDILAKATPMTIIHDGQTIEGTFMENAVGDDVNRLTADSLMLQANAASFNNGSGLKRMADLQILDYICGNIDRHAGNIFFQFEKNENGEVLLKGVQGIDNDLSFGENTFEEIGGANMLTTLDQINYMSRSCCETITNLNPDALRLILQDKLKPRQVEAAVTRLNLLKEEISKDRIKVVQDNEWGKDDYTFENITNGAMGLFNVVKSPYEYVVKNKDTLLQNAANNSALNYAVGKDVTYTADQRFGEIYGKINGFAQTAQNLKGALHIDSAEYKAMQDSLKDVKAYGDQLNEKLANGESITREEFTEFAQKTYDMGVASQNYLGAKGLSQSTTLGQNRFAFATEMRDLAQENFTLIEKQPEPQKEGPEEDMDFRL